MKEACFAIIVLSLVTFARAGDEGVTLATEAVPDGSNILGICTLPVDPGHVCKEASQETRYGYDIKQRQCVEFIYLGCGGTSNNFDSLVECRKTCEQ